MSSWDPNGPSEPVLYPQPGDSRPVVDQHVYRPEDFPFGGFPGEQPNYPPPNYPPPNYPPYGYHSAPAFPGAYPTSTAGGPAGMGDRLLAKIIDGLVIVLPFAILLAWAMSAENEGVQTPISLFALVANLAYETYFIAYRGATIGKRLRGIRVVDELTGARLSPGKALLRSFLQYISNYALLAGCWSPFLDRPRRRGWHDKAARDVVITNR